MHSYRRPYRWKERAPSARPCPGGKWPLCTDHPSRNIRRDRVPRPPAGASAPSSPPRAGFMPRRGVSPFLAFSARSHVSPERPPHRNAPCSAWRCPRSPSRARPATQAPRQAHDFPRLRQAVCVLRDRAWTRPRDARSRLPAQSRGNARPGQPRRRVPDVQSTEGRDAPQRVLRTAPMGGRELHALRAGGAPQLQAGGAEGGVARLRTRRLTTTDVDG